MTQWPENDDILNEVAMVYFDYHGDLPGPATLNLTLSNRYGSQNVFWHYYNEDRSRIDYYGATYANAKGAISVPIDHCSTYVVSRVHAIVGAENQEGNLSRISKAITTGTGTNPSASSSGKLNPQTSAGDGA